jgi:peptidoglycan/LPS O-acetylase OafA/YrhL
MATKTKRYLELDSLRGIAVLMVFLFHFVMITEEYYDWFVWGTMGVDLFFIISGFVITMSIERVSSGREFIINRFARLYPTYWTAVTFTFGIICIVSYYKGEAVSLQQYWGNMTMFQFYLGIRDLDGPYWTMIIEMLFYIFIFILYQIGWFHKIVLIGTVLTVGITLTVISFQGEFMESLTANIPLMQFFPLFFAGILFYKVINEKKIGIYYALILLCLICQLALFPYVGRSRMFLNQVDYTIVLSLFFFVLFLFVNNKLQFVKVKPLLFLGKVSYAFYLTHYYISSRHVVPFLYHKMELNFWLVLPISISFCVLLAWVITKFIEVPLNKRLRVQLKKTE